MRRSRFPLGAVLATVVCATHAHAQTTGTTPPSDPDTTPPGVTPTTPTTPRTRLTGPTPQGTVSKTITPPKSEVVKEGIQGGPQRDPTAPPEDTTELSISGGALLAGGNSRLGAVTGALKFLVLRGASQFSGGAAANYAKSKSDPDQGLQTTVENYQAGVRYDYFISQPVALFLAFVGRRDRFQGLDLRASVDPGVALFMVREQDLRLWGEVGYDLQDDVRTEEAVADAEAEGFELESSEITHNGRLFLGYQQRLEDRLRFDAGVEYIRNFFDAERFRLNYSASLATQISGKLSIGVVAAALYDNHPLPNVEKLDVMTSINLVYTLY